MIKNIVLLTKISTRNFWKNFNLFNKDTKKINKKSIYVWLFLIVIMAITYLSNELLNMLEDYGQLQIFPNILFAIAIVIMFIQIIIASMNILYFSKDIEYMLPMPIRTEELLLSRVNTLINMLYGVELLFMLIPLILYGASIMAPLSYYVFVIVVLMLLPIFPTVFVTIVTLVIMKFIKKIKNKNTFQICVTLLAILFIVFAEVIFIKGVTSNQINQELIEVNVNHISESINSSFIVINPLISILNQDQIFLNLLKVISVYVLMYAILIWIGNKTYIKNILKTTVYNKNRHQKEINFEKQCKTHKPITSYIKNEWKSLLKNAIFFIQTIYPIALTMIMLIFIAVYLKIGAVAKNQELSETLNGMNLTLEGVCIIFGIIQVLCSMPNISITSISRQGKNAVFMKYIPISLYKQFWVKNIPQIVISSVISIIVVILAKLLFPAISIWQIILLILTGMIIGVVNSFLMLIVDMKRPILDWKSEVDIFKQNGNKIFQYVWTIIAILLLMYIRKICENLNVYFGILVMFIFFAIVFVIINVIIIKQIKKNKLFKNII